MQGSTAGAEREQRRAEAQLRELLHERLVGAADRALAARGGLRALAQAVAERRTDPYTAADEVAATVLR
jgi:hypothetical protein